MANYYLHEHRILKHLENGNRVTQRDLSRQLGIALGLTNLLIRRLAKKGWIRISRVQPNCILYLITPAGISAKAQLTRDYVRESVRFYRQTRDRIGEQLSELSAALSASEAHPPVVFYGTCEVAEIAYLCLQSTTLQLIAVVDANRDRPFFSIDVHHPSELSGNTLAGRRFAHLIVMPVDDEERVRDLLDRQGVSAANVCWL